MKTRLEELLGALASDEEYPAVLYRGDPLVVPGCKCSGLIPKYARSFCLRIEKPSVREEGLLVQIRRLLSHHFRTKAQRAESTVAERLVFPVEKLSDWDVLLLAQHYGLDTRFLDWSTDPIVALWFATHKFTKDGGVTKSLVKGVADEDSVLTILDLAKCKGNCGNSNPIVKELYDAADKEKTPFYQVGNLRTVFFKPKKDLGSRVTHQRSVMCRQVFHPSDQACGQGCQMVPLDQNVDFKDAIERVVISRSDYAVIHEELEAALKKRLERNGEKWHGDMASFIFPDWVETQELYRELKKLSGRPKCPYALEGR